MPTSGRFSSPSMPEPVRFFLWMAAFLLLMAIPKCCRPSVAEPRARISIASPPPGNSWGASIYLLGGTNGRPLGFTR